MNKKFVFIFLTFLTLVLVFLWFRNRLLVAGAEEALVFYDPLRTMHLFASPWYQVSTGEGLPVLFPRFTMLVVPVLLALLHMPNWFGQATILFSLVLVAVFGMYMVTKKILGTNSYFIPLFAALFYLFNLYTQSQVIGRLLFTNIMGWAYLPIFFLLIFLWVKEKSYKSLIAFGITSFLFSQAFGMPTFVITLWSPVIIWFIYLCIQNFYIRKTIFAYTRRLFGIGLLWMLVNFWWIWPYARLSSSAFSSVEGSAANFGSLQGVSQYFPTSQLIILRHFGLFNPGAYYNWYSTPYAYSISYLILILVALGIVRLRKEKNWLFLVALLFVGWFVSKGTNPPFGYYFFSKLFKHIPSLQAFRNPYEKFGIAFLFPYAIFFAGGFQYLLTFFKNTKKYLLAGLITFLVFGILAWPILSGDVFGASVINVRVQVPHYYEQANDYLNQDKSDYRIVIMPLINGDSVRYLWQKGYYQGVNPSEFLYDKPSVSRILRIPYADDEYRKLYDAFVSDSPYVNILNNMNAKYIIVNEDLDWKFSGASSSAVVERQLSNTNGIVFTKRIGKLAIYKNTFLKKPSLFQLSNGHSGLSYKKISPTHYLVYVSHIMSPVSLFFKDTYNTLWQAKINGIVVKNHSLALGYANSWLLTKKGSYTIDVVLKIWPWE